MRNKIILTAVLVSGIVTQTTKPLSCSNAKMASVGIGALASALTHYGFEKMYLTGIAGVGTGVLSYYVLHRFTPEGRLKRAVALMNRIIHHPIAMQKFEEQGSFFEAVEEVYVGDDYWLIIAKNDFVSLMNDAQYAIELLEKARAEEADKYLFVQECNRLIGVAHKAILNLADGIKRIKKHDEYLTQQKQYDKKMAKEKQLEIQQSMANAQWSQASAHWK